MLLVGGLVGLFSVLQTYRVSVYQSDIQEYIRKISALEQAVLLTKSLQKANAELIEERNAILEELRDTAGYSDPLPDELHRTLKRVQSVQ